MRADFYVGLGDNARWLGSIANGGNPAAVGATHDLFNLDGDQNDYSEKTFVGLVESIITDRHDQGYTVRLASSGGEWPWDYDRSTGTDYTYAWNNGCIHVFEYGFMIAQHYPNGARKPSTFPSMVRKHPANPVAGS
jgi:hypothetical protein